MANFLHSSICDSSSISFYSNTRKVHKPSFKLQVSNSVIDVKLVRVFDPEKNFDDGPQQEKYSRIEVDQTP